MKYVLLFYLTFQVHFIFSQDSVKIWLMHPNDQLNVLAEGIELSGSKAKYFKVYADVFSVRIKLNRYKKMLKFLQESLTEKAIQQTPTSEEEPKHLFPLEVIFDFYYGKTKKSYSFDYTNKTKKNIVWKVVDFWKRFLREHGCKNSYQIHTIKKNETLHSIAKKYGLDAFTLTYYNNMRFDILRELNNRLMVVGRTNQGEEKLVIGEKLVIPCLPKKISKYE